MTSSSDPLITGDLTVHVAALRRLARSLVRDEAAAEDLVQETLATAAERPPRSGASLGSWLKTVARRLALDRIRSEGRRSVREQRASRAESVEGPLPALERLELGRELFDAVVSLREPFRTAIYLRFWEGLEPAAIADRLGVPVKTVKSRLYRAIEELRVRLDARSTEGRERWLPALTAFAFPEGKALVAGGLLVKKVLVAVIVVALAAIAWKSLRFTAGVPSAPAESAVAQQLDAGSREPAGIETAGGEVGRSSIESSQQTAKPSTGSLDVRFRWKDGSPAADISVDVRCDSDPAPREEYVRRRTDSDGRMRLTELFPGEVDFFVDRGPALVTKVGAGVDRIVEFELSNGATVVGRVVDSEGRSVAGAEIWIAGMNFMCSRWHRAARAGLDGSFSVGGLGPEPSIGARAPGHLASTVFPIHDLPARADGAREVTFELAVGGAEVEGRVVDPHGAPVAGAFVKVGERGGGSIDLPNGLRGEIPGPLMGETDADGRFLVVGNVRSGWEPVFVSARGWPVWSRYVEAVEGQRVRVDVALADPISVEGRVVDHDERPVEGARVTVSSDQSMGRLVDGFPSPSARTDQAGRFLLEWVAPGSVMLQAYVPQHTEMGKARMQVSCAPEVLGSAELVLDPGTTISGRLVDEDGKPLADWMIDAIAEPDGSGSRGQTQSDADGRFVVANVDSDRNYLLRPWAHKELGRPPRVERKNVEPGSRDVEIVVPLSTQSDARVLGRFLGRDGRPPADVKLLYEPEGSRESWYVQVDPETGAFEQTLRPGRCRLWAENGGRMLLRTELLDLAAKETKDLGILALAELGRLELRLPGVPEADLARLYLFLQREGCGSERLHFDGEVFRSREILPGTWTLDLVDSWIIRPRPVEIRGGETTSIECAAERGFEVSVDCAFADADAKWATLTARVLDDQGKTVQRGWTWFPKALEHGRVHLSGLTLPAGTFVLEASTDSGMRASARIEVGSETTSRPATTLVLR